ncbi:isoflavone reductase family protein [Trichophyton verrucosum HKI 0517]|uniref:Isoflavone reductase family protein n=1 Tax=Trichophyton verrucosum (strain HKI 0517) TaxID=663202 RepID=D4D391_TRIVH|nr:isoflavone reductase family protein [Trichophyton verrucosum HKI 0517]EFE43690.1 isoflavone reductase family protein [Trichophyton verrucosum HKI 0517]
MVKVAIAGGSSPTLGHSVVSALLATNGRHTPVILSRKREGGSPASSTAAWAVPGSSSTAEVETRYVDYESKDSLVAALHDIDTVISVLLIHDTDTFVNTQIRLLHAAEAAGCRRFAPSEFSGGHKLHFLVDFEREAKLPVWEAVLQSNIDAALFANGMFMNYLGIGSPEKDGNRAEALAGFAEGPLLFNLVEGWVEVPVVVREGGSVPPPAAITMTNIRDIGRFIAAAIDLEEPWGKRELGMAGSTLQFDEIVSLIEKYTGRTMEVRPFTKKQVEERLASPAEGVLGIIEKLECQLKKVCCDGGITVQPTLNRLCPDVKPMTFEEFLKRYWAEPSGPTVDA